MNHHGITRVALGRALSVQSVEPAVESVTAPRLTPQLRSGLRAARQCGTDGAGEAGDGDAVYWRAGGGRTGANRSHIEGDRCCGQQLVDRDAAVALVEQSVREGRERVEDRGDLDRGAVHLDGRSAGGP